MGLICVCGQVIDQHTDTLRRMARLLQHLDPNRAHFDSGAVSHRHEIIVSISLGAKMNLRAHPVSKLQVSSYEVRMEVGQENVFDG